MLFLLDENSRHCVAREDNTPDNQQSADIDSEVQQHQKNNIQDISQHQDDTESMEDMSPDCEQGVDHGCHENCIQDMKSHCHHSQVNNISLGQHLDLDKDKFESDLDDDHESKLLNREFWSCSLTITCLSVCWCYSLYK